MRSDGIDIMAEYREAGRFRQRPDIELEILKVKAEQT
jgi:hypothetical protein